MLSQFELSLLSCTESSGITQLGNTEEMGHLCFVSIHNQLPFMLKDPDPSPPPGSPPTHRDPPTSYDLHLSWTFRLLGQCLSSSPALTSVSPAGPLGGRSDPPQKDTTGDSVALKSKPRVKT